MYQHLIAQTQDDISTVRSIIKTNENLIKITLQDKDEKEAGEYKNFIAALKSNFPKTQDWRLYNHCSAVTKLYAIYENFVENLIRDWLVFFPKLYPNYFDLDKKIRDTHRKGIGKLLDELNKNRYEHLSIEDVVRSLSQGIINR